MWSNIQALVSHTGVLLMLVIHLSLEWQQLESSSCKKKKKKWGLGRVDLPKDAHHSKYWLPLQSHIWAVPEYPTTWLDRQSILPLLGPFRHKEKKKIRLTWSGGFIAKTEAVGALLGRWLHSLKNSQCWIAFYKGVTCVRRKNSIKSWL